MFDREGMLEIPFAEDDVEPAASAADAVPGEVLSGQPDHSRLLPGIDRMPPSPVRFVAPRLHLHEDQQLSRLGDEIKLPEPRVKIPGQDAIALTSQPTFGFRLPGMAERLTLA